jgi:ribosomal protein S27E
MKGRSLVSTHHLSHPEIYLKRRATSEFLHIYVEECTHERHVFSRTRIYSRNRCPS